MIWLGGNLTPQDISLKRVNNNLVLKIISSGETCTVDSFFWSDSTRNRIEQIMFMDGTVWDESDIIRIAYGPTEGNDNIYGSNMADDLRGLGGDDWMTGLAGDDLLRHDSADDSIYAGAAKDTYIFDGRYSLGSTRRDAPLGP